MTTIAASAQTATAVLTDFSIDLDNSGQNLLLTINNSHLVAFDADQVETFMDSLLAGTSPITLWAWPVFDENADAALVDLVLPSASAARRLLEAIDNSDALDALGFAG